MRALVKTAILTLAAASTALAAEPAQLAAGALQENFVINAQYRGPVNKSFKGLGKGHVTYRPGTDGNFGVIIVGTLQNPDTREAYKMSIDGDFKISGSSIQKVNQKLQMNEEAKRYEALMTHNLPFVYLARFQNLPNGQDAEERAFTFEGREYMLRYVSVENAIEATLFETGVMIGKFFLHGDYGQPPKGLIKARMVGVNHLVFSLVVDRGPAESSRGE